MRAPAVYCPACQREEGGEEGVGGTDNIGALFTVQSNVNKSIRQSK